jgi:hypothetical protein
MQPPMHKPAAEAEPSQPPNGGPPEPGQGAPGPHGGPPGPQTGSPDAQTGSPDPLTGSPDAQTGSPDPLSGSPDAQTGALASEPGTPGDGLEGPYPDPIEALPGIARVAADAALRLASWGIGASARATGRLARAATDPDAAAQLVEEVSNGLRAYAREFLGVADLDDRLKRLDPPRGEALSVPVDTAQLLRAHGTELLRQSADVRFDGEAHPAYARILSEIVPDEGRMLRLLATVGAQPIVDVRAGNLIGVGSQLVARGINMIGAQAGVRHRDRVAAYLHNLFRLGLIAFSDEPLPDPIAYQVLEAQPDVLTRVKQTTRAKTVHRQVALTPLGIDFCAVCFPLDDTTTAIDATAAELPPG